jgi:hypothetical protein
VTEMISVHKFRSPDRELPYVLASSNKPVCEI